MYKNKKLLRLGEAFFIYITRYSKKSAPIADSTHTMTGQRNHANTAATPPPMIPIHGLAASIVNTPGQISAVIIGHRDQAKEKHRRQMFFFLGSINCKGFIGHTECGK